MVMNFRETVEYLVEDARHRLEKRRAVDAAIRWYMLEVKVRKTGHVIPQIACRISNNLLGGSAKIG